MYQFYLNHNHFWYMLTHALSNIAVPKHVPILPKPQSFLVHAYS